MKTIPTTLLLLLALSTWPAFGTIIGYEFDWTAQAGYSGYNSSIIYSGGITAGGIFTPTGLVGYSFGTPFGNVAPATHYPGFGFVTDTPYGPSFKIGGAIQPVDYLSNPFAPGYQEFGGNSLELYFQGLTELSTYFTNGTTFGDNITGTWTETIINAPDAANSVVLLAVALGGLGLFHAARRSGKGANL